MVSLKMIRPVRYLLTRRHTFKGYPIHLDLWTQKYMYFMMDIHGVIRKKYVRL